MGVLARTVGGRRITLGARTVVGRASSCGVRLEHPLVSAEHAAIYWHDGVWMVRDLSSTNGTYVDGERLAPAERRALRHGHELSFGASTAGESWALADDRCPIARARCGGASTEREARGRLLVLPDDENPQVSIFPDLDGEWTADLQGEVSPLVDQQELLVDGASWCLELPSGRDDADLSTTASGSGLAQLLDAWTFSFRVSRDEEFVELELRCGAHTLPVPPRGFHYTLLTLARHRIADEALPMAERGWVYADALAAQVGVPKARLNLDVCRAKQQIAELGIADAGLLVERRRTAHQLRLGVSRIAIAPIA